MPPKQQSTLPFQPGNDPLDLTGMEESLPTVARASSPSPSEFEQTPSQMSRLDALERHAISTQVTEVRIGECGICNLRDHLINQ